jgi:Tol biopolymer transport system component
MPSEDPMVRVRALVPLARAGALVVGTLGLVTLAACSDSTGQGTGNLPTSLVNRLVFVSFRQDVRGDLYSVRPDGSDQIRLSATSGRERYPAIAPGGLQVAFVSDASPGDDGSGQCDPAGATVMAVPSGTRTTVVPETSLCNPGPLHWSHDGSRISVPGSGRVSGGFTTLIVSPDGSQTTPVSSCFQGGVLVTDWAPDRDAFVYHAACGQDVDLLVGGPQSSGDSLANDPLFNECCGAWSPDGSVIAFVRAPNVLNPDNTTPGAIFTVGPDGQGLTHLADRQPSRLAWSPDGSRIAFNEGAIYLMNADGSDIRRVSPDSLGVFEGPVWSPDGTHLAFGASSSGNREVFVIDADGSGLVNVSNDPGDDRELDWGR